jgi:hypothetical protein
MGQGIGEVLWGVDPKPFAPTAPAATVVATVPPVVPGGTPVGDGINGRSS